LDSREGLIPLRCDTLLVSLIILAAVSSTWEGCIFSMQSLVMNITGTIESDAMKQHRAETLLSLLAWADLFPRSTTHQNI
jgi:hypothetical protein